MRPIFGGFSALFIEKLQTVENACSSARADPDSSLADFTPSNLTSFVFRGLGKNGVVSVAPGGRRAALSVEVFPALKSLGITYVRFEMEPCGVNEPHTHPRATEILTLVSGGPLQVGFVDTKSTPHIDILYPGDVTIFPRGLLHFEVNVGKKTALFFSALNSENPGTLIPKRALIAALKTGAKEADELKAANPSDAGVTKLYKLDAEFCSPGKDITAEF
ncbi:hypothetical protein KFL_006830045 [Klebsormidium nitens]|uniref:Germin-like protein n=1 Tax=Klebsormidium nitens TaxID=105231 RepID=A0A1Y1IPU8_KLENI|nr:hypothetical protein KFL_006830045 [Klebsormidium nitens]|eukprot:GAQ90776.1 hypothetical protein KFL_006830045 [Klebsormidium nitens]